MQEQEPMTLEDRLKRFIGTSAADSICLNCENQRKDHIIDLPNRPLCILKKR